MEVLELQPGENFAIKTSKADEKENFFQIQQIERRSSDQLDYNEFYWNYMNANVPILLQNVSNKWECRRKWLTMDVDEESSSSTTTKINFNYLRNMTNEQVPVADCSKEITHSSHKKMPFHDFLDHWATTIINSSSSSSGNSNNDDITKVTETNSNLIDETKNLYLKDWHLKASLPNYNFYKVPKHFASDWLNEYLVGTARDDYRFVYMGPKGSWTPFHCDVFGSYSWSTNIFGIKKWLLLPPGEELKLMDKKKQPPFAIDEMLLQAKNVHFITLYQHQNEALFVPSGWYHQVTNLTDTISVNHNFINGCNLKNIWQNLSSSMQQVMHEIDDCREMENFNEHCQTMLRCSFGMNYMDFLDMLEFIAKRRLKDNETNILLFDIYRPNSFHILQDLRSIQTVLECFIQDLVNTNVVCDSQGALYERSVCLLESIEARTKN